MLKIELDCKNYSNFERIGIGKYRKIYKAKRRIQTIMLQ